MGTLMLVNPRRRRKSAKSSAPRRARRVRRTRRANPVAPIAAVRRRRYGVAGRRANPLRATRRRRNPSRRGSAGSRITMNSIVSMLKDAGMMGAGAVGIEAIMAQVNPMLPPSLQPDATGAVGTNDIVKAGLTILLGKLGDKMTRGASRKMAAGALAVQAATLLRRYLPASAGGTTAGIGYRTPNMTMPGVARIGPRIAGVYQNNQSALLSRVGGRVGMYQGGSPSLSRVNGARARYMASR